MAAKLDALDQPWPGYSDLEQAVRWQLMQSWTPALGLGIGHGWRVVCLGEGCLSGGRQRHSSLYFIS